MAGQGPAESKVSLLDKIAGHEGDFDWRENHLNAMVGEINEGATTVGGDMQEQLHKMKLPGENRPGDAESALWIGHSRLDRKESHHDLNMLGLKEHQLVHAWRSPFAPSWTLESREQGVVHKVHREDHTITIQFLSDQHRVRMHTAVVTPVDNTPSSYHAQWLHPGQDFPSLAACQAAAQHDDEHRAMLERSGHPVPPRFDKKDFALPPKRVERSDRWGMPTTTLIALRNRTIPMCEVTGRYDQHFYTQLYDNKFYPTKPMKVLDMQRGNLPGEPPITKHFYIPLSGIPKQQMEDNSWRQMAPEELQPGYYS